MIPNTAFAADLISVTPASVVNNIENTITISGAGFNSTAVVLLNGTALSTTFYNDQTLTAVIPAGYVPNDYDLSVTMTGDTVTPTSIPFKVNPFVPPAPTATPIVTPFARPQLRVSFSGASGKDGITSNKPFKFTVNFENAGSLPAYNTQATFSSADLVPLDTGGVAVLGSVSSGSSVSVDQRFISNGSLSGKSIVTIDVTLSYNDDKGNAYSDKFTLSASVSGGGGGSGVYYTATPTGVRSGQLIITSYGTDVDPLEPGTRFNLVLTVQNMGNEKAPRVTMIVGGGSSGSSDGTPQPGGVSGGNGEFTNFAPVGTSNIQSLGDLPAGGMVQAKQDLIVNVSTEPGAYPIKVTFSYLNAKGEVVNDEQVITLLVYSLPNLDISFYRPLDPFFVDQPGALPIQVVNLGKRTAVLGTITVTTDNGTVDGGTSLVGSLDKGGYYTLDATLTPLQTGPAKLNFVIEYTDDFNQKRTVEKTLDVNVEEGFIEPTPDLNVPLDTGGVPPSTEETFLQKTWRFVLGLLGLDSAPSASSPDMQAPPTDFQSVPSGGG
ncbi:MAG: IPT/TIG domain-containing protein [Anaerolineales bacterium]